MTKRNTQVTKFLRIYQAGRGQCWLAGTHSCFLPGEKPCVVEAGCEGRKETQNVYCLKSRQLNFNLD